MERDEGRMSKSKDSACGYYASLDEKTSLPSTKGPTTAITTTTTRAMMASWLDPNGITSNQAGWVMERSRSWWMRDAVIILCAMLVLLYVSLVVVRGGRPGWWSDLPWCAGRAGHGHGHEDGIRDTLLPMKYHPLPLGTIKPLGWLADQLHLMANGLAGHEHDFYRFVRDSPWLGGSHEYSDLNEAFPYWLNGIVPLAYALDDARLKRQIRASVDYVLGHQAEDGWLGPETRESGLRNLWGRYPLLHGLMQLLEADGEQYSDTVLPAVRRYVDLVHTMLGSGRGAGYLERPGDKLSSQDHGWARIRAADMMLSMQWLVEHDDKGGQRKKLFEIMRMLRKGALDWSDWYNKKHYIRGDVNEANQTFVDTWFAYEHGVNVAQGLKAGAVINRFEHNETMVTLARRAVHWTFKYHGSASGSILADERLAGLAPYYGIELCTTVEAIYSLSYLYQALGDNEFADRAELAAFNALPAAVLGDWWAHQYVTQANQPFAKELRTPLPFWNVNGVGQTFGLEPDYPCCTVNHVQGYPKFLVNSWVTIGGDGIAHVLLSPSSVKTRLTSGIELSISANTQYPFADTIEYSIVASAPFKLYVRIPSWSKTWTVSGPKTAGQPKKDQSLNAGMVTISVGAGTSQLVVELKRTITTIPRLDGAIAIMHGPLLYSLDVGYKARSQSPRHYRPDNGLLQGDIPVDAKDWEILNTKPWNIAIKPHTIRAISNVEDGEEHVVPKQIWSPRAPPVYLEAEGVKVEWPLYGEMPGKVPRDPTVVSKSFQVRFWPVGSTKIGMVELPTIP